MIVEIQHDERTVLRCRVAFRHTVEGLPKVVQALVGTDMERRIVDNLVAMGKGRRVTECILTATTDGNEPLLTVKGVAKTHPMDIGGYKHESVDGHTAFRVREVQRGEARYSRERGRRIAFARMLARFAPGNSGRATRTIFWKAYWKTKTPLPPLHLTRTERQMAAEVLLTAYLANIVSNIPLFEKVARKFGIDMEKAQMAATGAVA